MGRILDLIFPENIYCICCNDMIDKSRVHGICDNCLEKINWSTENHFRNKMQDFAFDDVLSCCIYGDYPRSIIYELKAYGKTYIARDLGRLFADRIELSRFEDDLKVDFLVPVPCTKKKKLKRGFNQAELISEFTSKETGIPIMPALEKIRETKASKTSRGHDRYFVQQGAFSMAKGCDIMGRRILLVDDVITTGSTVDECARVLKSAGAGWVGVLCFASSAIVGQL